MTSYLGSLRVAESAFQLFPKDLVEIMLEVRSIALEIKPWASERVRSTGLTLFDQGKGGTVTGGICFVDVRNGFVRVRFGRGSLLKDPRSLLSGDQKFMRHVDIRSFEDAPWSDLESLLRESANLDESAITYEYHTRSPARSDLEANKQNAIAFYQLAYQGDPRSAVELYVGKEYIQHNPLVGNGPEPFIDYFERMASEYPDKSIAFVRVIAEGDLVALHTHQVWPGGDEYVTMDFFRFDDDGKIVEHWDSMQQVPKTSANGNTMY